MRITKCDACGAEISGKPIIIGVNSIFPTVEICQTCARPVIDFLDEKQLLQDRLTELGLKKQPDQVS
jgi:ribosome-binding protein aMBF1 (putative translation factor)